jgi:hypothetical protein
MLIDVTPSSPSGVPRDWRDYNAAAAGGERIGIGIHVT